MLFVTAVIALLCAVTSASTFAQTTTSQTTTAAHGNTRVPPPLLFTATSTFLQFGAASFADNLANVLGTESSFVTAKVTSLNNPYGLQFIFCVNGGRVGACDGPQLANATIHLSGLQWTQLGFTALTWDTPPLRFHASFDSKAEQNGFVGNLSYVLGEPEWFILVESTGPQPSPPFPPSSYFTTFVFNTGNETLGGQVSAQTIDLFEHGNLTHHIVNLTWDLQTPVLPVTPSPTPAPTPVPTPQPPPPGPPPPRDLPPTILPPPQPSGLKPWMVAVPAVILAAAGLAVCTLFRHRQTSAQGMGAYTAVRASVQ